MLSTSCYLDIITSRFYKSKNGWWSIIISLLCVFIMSSYSISLFLNTSVQGVQQEELISRSEEDEPVM